MTEPPENVYTFMAFFELFVVAGVVIFHVWLYCWIADFVAHLVDKRGKRK